MKTTGEKIKELRKKLDLTLGQLGDEIGVSHTAIDNWENNDPIPSIKRLTRLAEFFKIDVSYFLDKDLNSPEERDKAALEIKIKKLEKELEVIKKEREAIFKLNQENESYILKLIKKIYKDKD